MADLYVKSTGSNTSPYDTWAKAANTPGTALAAASAGDAVWIYAETFTVAADTIYAPADGVRVIAVTDTNEPPTTEVSGSTYAVIDASATAGAEINLNGNAYWFGIHLKGGSGSNGRLRLANVSGSSVSAENCFFENTTTSAAANMMSIGLSNSSPLTKVRTRGCVFKWAYTGAIGFSLYSFWESLDDVLVASSGVSPSLLFDTIGAGGGLRCVGGDLSSCTGTVFEDSPASSAFLAWLSGCKLGSGTVYAPTVDYGEVYVLDSSSGDIHYNFAHYHYRGTTLIDASHYVTADGASYDGTNRHSWKISSTANASRAQPYYSPWIPVYHAGTSAITPYIEALRKGNTTAYKETEVWVEAMVKTTSGSTRMSYATNRDPSPVAIASGADNAASSLTASDWTGEDATNNSFMRLELDASVTPAEIGHTMLRIVIGKASVSDLYVDPQIRGLS